jgi:hypothetical protein
MNDPKKLAHASLLTLGVGCIAIALLASWANGWPAGIIFAWGGGALLYLAGSQS